MARVKLSEFRAKNLLAKALGYSYDGQEIDAKDQKLTKIVDQLSEGSYVVKVDQATKKRNQLGLIKLNRTRAQIADEVNEMAAKGYRFFLVEPMIDHDQSDEHFLALMRTEAGIEVHYSAQGGADIEANPDSINKSLIEDQSQIDSVKTELKPEALEKLINLFNQMHIAYLEINPLLIKDGQPVPLDAAVEVDSTAELAVQGDWTKDDVRSASLEKTESEKVVEELQATSVSALTLRVMNPNGQILLLLSGGGASLVAADEFDAHDLSKELINYGEYSGAPNEDELYQYTLAALKLLKDSQAKTKVIVIAGGVANFTDIAVTFRGIIRAFEKEKDFLKQNQVAVFVRRGGPNQQKGLKLMKECLSGIGLRHSIHGPEVSLADIVKEVAAKVKHD